MHCYSHQDKVAICLCGNCLKGLCRDCATSYKHYTVCSDICQDDLAKREELSKRAQAIYNIGGAKGLQSISWLSLIFIVLGSIFIFWGSSELYLEGFSFPSLLSLLAGIFFVLAGITHWRRFKNTGIG